MASNSGHISGQASGNIGDPHLWLEEIESEEALGKVRSWNERSVQEIEADPRYSEIEREARKIVLAEDRIPYGTLQGGYVYNLWQDKVHVRGLWRRCSYDEYKKVTANSSNWETVLDLDELAKTESENWVWKGASLLEPKGQRCLIALSRGGKDASVVREFDLTTKTFSSNGFLLPEAKSSFDWRDENSLFVSTDFGPGTLTKAGYARQVRLWNRGESLESAKLVYEATEDDVWAGAWCYRGDGSDWNLVYRGITFFTCELFVIGDDLSLAQVPVPESFMPSAIKYDRLIGQLRSEWQNGNRTFKPGSIVSVNLKDLSEPAELVYEPQPRSSVESTSASRNYVYLSISVNVKGGLLRAWRDSNGWKTAQVDVPSDGQINILSASPFADQVLLGYSSFLTPPSILSIEEAGSAQPTVQRMHSLPERFDASQLMVEQHEAVSRDGERIPYFIVRPKELRPDGENPTVLNGYGGFQLSYRPSYSGVIGKAWCEKGGVYVLANIRGGGEFGPQWHEASRLKNRQRCFDDFIAVAEDLVRRGITKPQRLGILGGSNGGLLVGATFTQRPDLFNAVVCQVPLLDMLRYHKLLAGFSWMGEYGDPDDPEMLPVIRAYSPYHNLNKEAEYPRVFFMTSTRDDRVHPGHARKMAARMEEMGHPFLYYENIEGGHAGSANLEQSIRFQALEWAYFWKQLG